MIVAEVLGWVALAFLIAGIGGVAFGLWWRSGEVGYARTESAPVIRQGGRDTTQTEG
ncbi:hypothetical protein [Nocardia fusca]|uniref:Secreted protein with PEP-CTERM sorting signal n=1 Tax=Nocardia fusca TaxID=941183 RepID=A0ABV3FIK9_9NOCA